MLAAFENNMVSYQNHFVVAVPAELVTKDRGLAPLKDEVRIWLFQNVGDNRGSHRPEHAIWEYVSCMGITAKFAFLRQEDAVLFKMFFG